MRVVFCIPGNNFSNDFLMSWSSTLIELMNNNIEVVISNKYTSNIFFVRNMCLGANVMLGKSQKPFGGNLEYDYIFWIDSDVIFTSKDVLDVIQIMENDKTKNIVSGMYLMDNGIEYTTVDKGNFDFNAFVKNNGSFTFMDVGDVLLKRDELFEVDYTGFGFICIRQGIFEKLEYPWFSPTFINIDVSIETPVETDEPSGENITFSIDENTYSEQTQKTQQKQPKKIQTTQIQIKDTCSEDVAFCRKVIELGEKVWCVPTVQVGHLKNKIHYNNITQFIDDMKKNDSYEKTLQEIREKKNKQ